MTTEETIEHTFNYIKSDYRGKYFNYRGFIILECLKDGSCTVIDFIVSAGSTKGIKNVIDTYRRWHPEIEVKNVA